MNYKERELNILSVIYNDISEVLMSAINAYKDFLSFESRLYKHRYE